MLRRLSAFAVVLAACPPPTAGGTDGDPTTGTSTTTGESTTSTSTAPTTSTGGDTAAPSPDLPPPCPVGSLGCPCTEGGSCDGFLACEAGTCAEGCAVGSLGCPCTQGLGCDAGLKCDDAGTCVDDPMLSPPCMPGVPMDDCCGDGILDDFEECDGALGAEGPCTPTCKKAVCGDGLIYNPVEACDGGEHCTDLCTFDTCGDGKVDPWEWCEKTGAEDVECSNLCIDARKIVFVTSEHYQGGALGGLDGANAKCQAHADGAGLPGEFMALLGTTEENAPLASLTLHNVPHYDVNGALVFGAETNKINYYFCGFGGLASIPDEFGNPHPGCSVEHKGELVWAWFIFYFYDPSSPPTCDGWTDIDATGGGAVAAPCSMSGSGAPCDAEAPIYCVEV